jgi:4-amino-4-deoxy-L-arabinose transferase-like glycosyltransferase
MDAKTVARWGIWILVVVLGTALLVGLNSWGPLESSEARYAEIGREMLVSGDWLHPRLLGIQHFHKPPLTYWLTAVGLTLAGPVAAGVRLLPVLAVLVQVGLMFGLGQLFFAGDRLRALAVAVVYATMPVVLIGALNVTTDAYLATWELAAAYGLLRYYQGGKPGWLYLFWLMLGLAFLTKGPVGFVLPLMAMAGYYFRQQRARRPFTVHHALGMGLFVAVGLSWYLYLVAENPAFVRYFLVEHTIERFANPETFGRSQPWWFYLVLAPATSLPWSAVLLTGAVRTPWRELPPGWRNVLLFWVLLPLLFFSLSSSKLLLYVLPVFPGVALLVVYYLSCCPEARQRLWYRRFVVFFSVLLLAMLLLPVVIAVWDVPLSASPLVALGAGAGLLALALQHLFWRPAQYSSRLLLTSLLFTISVLLTAKTVLSQNESLLNGVRPLAARLKRPDLAGRPVLVYNRLLPSLAFELAELPVSLYDGEHTLRRETQFEVGTAWQHWLINMWQPTAPPRAFTALVASSPVVVVRGALDRKHQWLRIGLSQQEQLGPWYIYYAR